MMKKTKQTIERMVLMVEAAMVMVSLAAPAMAEEVVREHRDVSSGKAQPIIRDHAMAMRKRALSFGITAMIVVTQLMRRSLIRTRA